MLMNILLNKQLEVIHRFRGDDNDQWGKVYNEIRDQMGIPVSVKLIHKHPDIPLPCRSSDLRRRITRAPDELVCYLIRGERDV